MTRSSEMTDDASNHLPDLGGIRPTRSDREAAGDDTTVTRLLGSTDPAFAPGRPAPNRAAFTASMALAGTAHALALLALHRRTAGRLWQGRRFRRRDQRLHHFRAALSPQPSTAAAARSNRRAKRATARPRHRLLPTSRKKPFKRRSRSQRLPSKPRRRSPRHRRPPRRPLRRRCRTLKPRPSSPRHLNRPPSRRSPWSTRHLSRHRRKNAKKNPKRKSLRRRRRRRLPKNRPLVAPSLAARRPSSRPRRQRPRPAVATSKPMGSRSKKRSSPSTCGRRKRALPPSGPRERWSLRLVDRQRRRPRTRRCPEIERQQALDEAAIQLVRLIAFPRPPPSLTAAQRAYIAPIVFK